MAVRQQRDVRRQITKLFVVGVALSTSLFSNISLMDHAVSDRDTGEEVIVDGNQSAEIADTDPLIFETEDQQSDSDEGEAERKQSEPSEAPEVSEQPKSADGLQELSEIQSDGPNSKTRSLSTQSAPVTQPYFSDVSSSYLFYNEISWMFEEGITTGWVLTNTREYRPESNLERAAMAAFLFRLYAPTDYEAPAKSPFIDVTPSHQFYKEIAWMHQSGLATGWKTNKGFEYRPSSFITRDAMAAFLFRQFAPENYKAPSSSVFADVNTSNQFFREISWMYESGLSTGWVHEDGNRTYRYLDHLSRGATAAFIYRSVNPVINPPVIKDMKVGSLVVEGSGRVGEKLEAVSNGWTPQKPIFTYQWKRNGSNITGATASSYTPSVNDVGKKISVAITAKASGYGTATANSTAVIISQGKPNSNNFKADYIISDANFYDGNAMSVAEIQVFLERMNPKCLIGTKGFERGKKIGNTKIADACLPQAKFFSHGDPANNACTGLAQKRDESAAEIIYRVGKACGISQKVLLVMLQKEQSLITDDWPTQRMYDVAMGYGCPDTGPNYSANCDSKFVGFYEQVSWAAWALKDYKQRPDVRSYKAFQNNTIKYNPVPSCGTTGVHIKNYATAALYIYTPYVPNQAALQAGFGAGDGCSSYGNRNFYLFYNQWFGPTV